MLQVERLHLLNVWSRLHTVLLVIQVDLKGEYDLVGLWYVPGSWCLASSWHRYPSPAHDDHFRLHSYKFQNLGHGAITSEFPNRQFSMVPVILATSSAVPPNRFLSTLESLTNLVAVNTLAFGCSYFPCQIEQHAASWSPNRTQVTPKGFPCQTPRRVYNLARVY